MKRTRRQFIKLSAATGGALAFGTGSTTLFAEKSVKLFAFSFLAAPDSLDRSRLSMRSVADTRSRRSIAAKRIQANCRMKSNN